MTSGRLSAVDISAGTNTLIYTVTESKSFSVTVNISNRNDSDVVIRLAFVDGVLADLSDEDWKLLEDEIDHHGDIVGFHRLFHHGMREMKLKHMHAKRDKV